MRWFKGMWLSTLHVSLLMCWQYLSQFLLRYSSLSFRFYVTHGSNRALKVYLCFMELLQLRLMMWSCNDPATLSSTAAVVSGLWQNTVIPQWSQCAVKVLQCAGPQAQCVAHGYPWVFWQQRFVAGHQRKQWHTDNRWPLLSFTQPRDFCWLWVTKRSEQQGCREASDSVWQTWEAVHFYSKKQHKNMPLFPKCMMNSI